MRCYATPCLPPAAGEDVAAENSRALDELMSSRQHVPPKTIERTEEELRAIRAAIARGMANRLVHVSPPESRCRAAIRSALLRPLDVLISLSGSVLGRLRQFRRAVFNAFRGR